MTLRGLTNQCISIHALREEGDPCRPSRTCRKSISIHALREEGDYSAKTGEVVAVDFYPRPPRGGRRYEENGVAYLKLISIHALREEGDFAGLFYVP